MVTQNFSMTGASKLEANGFTINDSLGNNNGIVNRAECVKLNLGVKNNGCASETAISATLTTSTAGRHRCTGNSTYPDMAIDAERHERDAVQDLRLELVRLRHGDRAFTQPHLRGWNRSRSSSPSRPVPAVQINRSRRASSRRVIRRRPIALAGTDARAPAAARPARAVVSRERTFTKPYTFTNTAGAARCYTVTINAALGGPGDIESVAYDQVYDPTNIDTNYLGDSGISGLGTTVGQASYSFTVPAGHNFVVVVVTTGSTERPRRSVAQSPASLITTPDLATARRLPAAPAFTGAGSRLTHGAAGPFDLAMPSDGSGVEPRNGNGNYTTVLHFDMPMQSGNATCHVRCGKCELGELQRQ